MESVQKAILPLVILVCLLVFGYIQVIVPSYPEVDKEYSVHAVKDIVERNIENEIEIYNRLYQTNNLSKKDFDAFRQEVIKLAKKLDTCSDSKNCFVDAYHTFMSENVSNVTKKRTKYQEVQKLGALGTIINDSFSWTY